MAPARVRRTISDLPAQVPVFPLDGALLLPRSPLPLNIFEPRYLTMVDDALGADRVIVMTQTRPGGSGNAPALQPVGCLGRITSFSETGDGRYLITLSGVCRLHIAQELPVDTPYRQIQADYAPYAEDMRADAPATDFDRDSFLTVLRQYLTANDLAAEWESIEQAPMEMLINSLSMICPFSPAEKQALLEAGTVADRAEALLALMRMSTAAGGAEASGLQ